MSDPIDSLIWGTTQSDRNVTVYYVPEGGFRDGITSEGLNAYEKARFQEAFDRISAVTNLTFEITTNPFADLQIVLDTDELGGDFLGYFYPPGEFGAGIGVFNGDAWTRFPGGDLQAGGFGFVTVTHELLHGLGLAHPHDTGGTSDVMNGVLFEFDDYGVGQLNQGIYTTMSYNSGYPGGFGRFPVNNNYGYEAGPMALDIAVLQSLYGANNSYRTGNDVYLLPDANRAGTYWESVWDAGGVDEFRYTGSRDVNIDLRAATLDYSIGGGGYVSAADDVAGGYTIAHGVVIERATGGSGDDTLIGNGVANLLRGGAGRDRLTGDQGHDLLYGGQGNDNLQGNEGNDTLYGGRGNDSMLGHDGRDTLKGGRGDDSMQGGYGKDRMEGGQGHDRILGMQGADVLKGGRGNDDLHGGSGRDKLIGGRGNDTLTGSVKSDILKGGAGRDTFEFNFGRDSKAGWKNRDKITDFKANWDEIDLRSIDANMNRGGNQKFDFIGQSGFSDAGDLRIANHKKGKLVQADRDGDGRADFEILLIGARGLDADDFLL